MEYRNLYNYLQLFMMKNIYITALVILSAASVNAQVMPQELTCTEKAFNFSFSLGTKWKVITPKMGPVEVTSYEPDLIPDWSSKLNDVRPKTNPQSLSANLGYSIQRSGDILSGIKMIYKPGYILPDINFNYPINYTFIVPYFLKNQTFGL